MKRPIQVLVVATLLVLAGCLGVGDGDDETTAQSTDATTRATDATAQSTNATKQATDATTRAANATTRSTTAATSSTQPSHVGCQPGEVDRNGSCEVAVSGQNAAIFDASNLTPITATRTTLNGTPGYLARPADDGTYPSVVVIHEWWGLNENIEHMAEILAGHGYVVFAVDLYDGAVATNSSRAGELSSQVRANPEEAVAKMRRAVAGLREKPYTTRDVASLGWCFGGGQSLQLSLSDADLNATVVYYGTLATDAETLQRVDGPVLGIFGAEDTVVPVEDVRAFESTLEELGVEHEIYVYDGAGHAFANPSGESFHPNATRDAWAKTLAFLDEHLDGSANGTGTELANATGNHSANSTAEGTANETTDETTLADPRRQRLLALVGSE